MNTEKNKNKSLETAVKIGSGFLILLILTQLSFVSLAQAANPRFNIYTPYVHTQTANRDYFLLDVKNDTKGTGFNFPVSADPGDILTFSVYYHNGVNNTIANNTMLKVALPSGTASTQTLTASLWADNAENATAANPLSQSVTVNLSQSVSLQLVSGSVKWFPNQKSPLTDSPSSFSSGQTGSELFGSGLSLGNIEGCWEFSGFVNFQVKVGQASQTYDLSISKTIKNITDSTGYSESVNADNSDYLGFRLQIQNTGNITLNNVYVRDILPSYLSYVSGTTEVDGSSYSDGITSGSLNIGSISSGSTKSVTFQTTVNTSGLSSSQNLTNYGYAKADNVSEKTDTASVYVSVTTSTHNISIFKTIKNITDSTGYSESVSADQNDKVGFKIVIENTGNSSLTDLTVRDSLPSYLSYTSGTLTIGGSSGYSSTNFFSSNGVNTGSLSAGSTLNITFEAAVNTGTSQTLTNYGYAKADNVSEKTDSATVYVSGGVISSSVLAKKVANSTSPNGTETSNEALPGDILQYTISYTNTTGQTLYSVQIIDVLPSYVTFQDVSNSGSYDSSQNQITWNIGTLGSGSNTSVTYRVKVQTVPYTGFIIGNMALLKAQGISDVISNETRTVVVLPTVKGTVVRTITGSNSLVENIVYSLLISVAFSALLYFGLKYTDALRLLKLRYAILKIKARETF